MGRELTWLLSKYNKGIENCEELSEATMKRIEDKKNELEQKEDYLRGELTMENVQDGLDPEKLLNDLRIMETQNRMQMVNLYKKLRKHPFRRGKDRGDVPDDVYYFASMFHPLNDEGMVDPKESPRELMEYNYDEYKDFMRASRANSIYQFSCKFDPETMTFYDPNE